MDKDLLKKVLVLVVLLAVLGYVGNMYLLAPKRERIAHLDKEIKDVTLKIEKAKRSMRRAKALEREVAELEKKLEVMKAVLPTKEEIPGLIREISKLGYYNRINYALFQPGQEKIIAEKNYAVMPIRLEFQASYPQLVSLLNGVARMERLVKPVSLMVAYASKNRKVVLENPQLKVKCILETYRYVPVKKGKKGGKGGKKKGKR